MRARSVCPHQNDVKTLKKWMADVDVFLNEEWPALGDSEALEKQLEQCTVRRGEGTQRGGGGGSRTSS